VNYPHYLTPAGLRAVRHRAAQLRRWLLLRRSERKAQT
jgi:hypothetical protein